MQETLSQNISLPSSWSLLKQSFALYKKRFPTFFGLAAIGLVFNPFLILILSNSHKEIPTFFFDNLLVTIPVIIICLASIFLTPIALLFAIKDHQENIGIVEAYRRGSRKILSYWWISFLFIFYVMIGSLLIIPGIMAFIWFGFALFILLSENLTGINALIKSREYVRGIFFKIFGKIFYAYFLFFIISVLVAMILPKPEISPDAQLINSSITAVLLQILMIYSFYLYGYVKTAKGQIDLIITKRRKIKYVAVAILGFIALGGFFELIGAASAISESRQHTDAHLGKVMEMQNISSPKN